MGDERTICDIFFHGIGIRKTERILYKPKTGGGPYRAMSTDEFADRVLRTATVLAARGVGEGDRVVILSYNRPEWAIADFATLLLGAVSVPIYSTLPPDQVEFILNDCGAKLVFAENAGQLRKFSGRPAIVFDPADGAPALDDLLKDAKPASVDELRARAKAIDPQATATLIYTSGTTGQPKGVMLTHANLVSNLLATCRVIRFEETDVALSFLPLSHSFERIVDYGFFYMGATIAYAESTDTVPQNIAEVRPTQMAAVPRVYEKFHAKILDGVKQKSPLGQSVFRWAVSVGKLAAMFRQRGEGVPLGLRFRRWIAHTLVFRKVHARLGGRMRVMVSGSAPLSGEIIEFFWGIGLPILEGYGLTETSPVISCNSENAARPGTVGRVIPGVEVKIAADGEILCKGPNVMKGYYNRPEETASVIQDGWFATGDIGEFTKEGFLRITDRKKDLLKTSGGKYIAPQPIEGRLKLQPGVANAVVIGDGRKFPSVLLVPVPGATRDQLEAAVTEVNKTLAHHEALKKFQVVEKDFTIEGGELTPTMKVKRRVVAKKYAELIETMYAE